ncbi:MAG: MotA/TolQ/ExbB proton channel family protein [Thermodesulfobacteriota bacterium]
MKLRGLIWGTLLLWLLPLATATGAQEWERIGSEIVEENTTTEEEARYTLELVKKGRSELESELAAVQKSLAARKAGLEDRKATFKELLAAKNELESEIEEEKEEIKTVSDTVYNAAQRTSSLIGNSPVTAENPERTKRLEPLLTKKRFPGMGGIRAIVDITREEMAASGQIRLFEGTYVGPEYEKQTGDILRIGALTTAYRQPGGRVGYLELGEKNRLVAVPGDPSWFAKKSLKNYMNGKTDHVPMDVSGGAVFKRMAESRDIRDWLEAGGMLIWPILIVGVLGLALGLERFVFLLRIRSNSDRIMRQILDFIHKEQWQDAKTYCEKNKRFPTCNVLGTMFSHLGVTREAMENAIQEAVLRQIPRLERFVATLSILAAIAPLLGLLGTVTGMINTFQVITLFGTGDPKLMSGGISEALVTTQLGLAVAIPIMLLHHFLSRRVDKILGDIEEKGNKVTVELLKKGAITEGAA